MAGSVQTARMAPQFIAPEYGAKRFTCPRCGTLAPQRFADVLTAFKPAQPQATFSQCSACLAVVIWEARRVDLGGGGSINKWFPVYPDNSPAPDPNDDLPEDVRADYEEAARILNLSPKGAAALLRLAVQRLCVHLGKPGKNINDDIGALVADGMNPLIQQAMDTVRIVGNESVHPGEINLADDSDLALRLFDFVNLIAHDRLTTPRMVNEVYSRLPEAKVAAVERRDAAAEDGDG